MPTVNKNIPLNGRKIIKTQKKDSIIVNIQSGKFSGVY